MIGKKANNKEIEQLKKEIEEWKAKFLRALADYQNLEKRIREQRQEDTKYAAKNIIFKILPVLDALEQAAKNINKDQGFEIIIKQLKDILKSENVEKIEVTGKKFDPNFMECLVAEESDRDGEVLEELRPGYKILDTLLRAAQVKVGKKPAQPNFSPSGTIRTRLEERFKAGSRR